MKRLRALFGAYVDELASALESYGMGKLKPPPLSLVQEGMRYRLYRIDRGNAVQIAEGDWGQLADAPFPRTAKTQAIELRLDPHAAITKILNLPKASRSFADAIVRNQIERLTPWTADTVTYDYACEETKENGFSVRVVAAARDRVEAAVRQVAEAGLTTGVVGVSSDPLEKTSPIDLLHRVSTLRRKRLRRMAAASLVGIVLVAATASLLSGLFMWQLSAQAERLQTEVAAARAQVQSLADLTQTTAYPGIFLRKLVARPMVLVLEELSTHVPSHTYLTHFSVQDDHVRIGGLSEDAPELIAILEATALLSDVRFAAATMRDMVTGRDRFEIDAKIFTTGTEQAK